MKTLAVNTSRPYEIQIERGALDRAGELCAKARQLDPAGQRILFAPVTALPMASSALRQRLAAGEDCAEELPEAVRAVIRREHLYQT